MQLKKTMATKTPGREETQRKDRNPVLFWGMKKNMPFE